MKIWVKAWLLVIGCSLSLGGCVSLGTYKMKMAEAKKLDQSLQGAQASNKELQEKHDRLATENDKLASQVKKQSGELTELTKENEKLATASRPDNLLQTLAARFAELQNQVEALQKKNAKLEGVIAARRSGEDAAQQHPAEGEKE
jgi:peptidoglycan hydrolase CwlO-like protein